MSLGTKRLNRLERVNEVLTDLRDYWPITLRQVYYQLVAAGDIENNINSYKGLSTLLSEARLEGRAPWEALEDRSRDFLGSGGWRDKSHFARQDAKNFLRGYRRDLLQSQTVALEVWIEKDALSRICHRAASPYCVPVVVAKGYASTSYVNECRERIERHSWQDKRTIILYFGDLDPSGWDMLPSMLNKLQSTMNLGDKVEGQRHALTPPQVFAHNLPRDPEAMKDSDVRTPRYKAWLEQQGYPDDLAVELDALLPSTLENMVKDAIEQNLDLSQYQHELEQEQQELEELRSLKQQVQGYIESAISD